MGKFKRKLKIVIKVQLLNKIRDNLDQFYSYLQSNYALNYINSAR